MTISECVLQFTDKEIVQQIYLGANLRKGYHKGNGL